MTEITNGIVIKTTEFNDFDTIVTIYSQEYGLISFVALGTRRLESKNKSSIQLFSESKFEIFKSHRGKLSKLKKGYLLESNKNISKNYLNYLLAAVAADLTQQLFVDNEISNVYYRNFKLLLSSLAKDNYPFKTFTFFLFQALKYQNVSFDFTHCALCWEKNNSLVYFDSKNFEFICNRCFQKLSLKEQSFIFDNASLNESLEKI